MSETERPYISPHVVNMYMSYMRRSNPGRGMTLEEFAMSRTMKLAAILQNIDEQAVVRPKKAKFIAMANAALEFVKTE